MFLHYCLLKICTITIPVSYTHLDVYKRQVYLLATTSAHVGCIITSVVTITVPVSGGISVGTSSSLIIRPISPVTFGPHIMYLTIATIWVVTIPIVIVVVVEIWPVVVRVIRPIGCLLYTSRCV